VLARCCRHQLLLLVLAMLQQLLLLPRHPAAAAQCLLLLLLLVGPHYAVTAWELLVVLLRLQQHHCPHWLWLLRCGHLLLWLARWLLQPELCGLVRGVGCPAAVAPAALRLSLLLASVRPACKAI
jgi:hypothetical protein